MYSIAKIPNGEISYYKRGHGDPIILLNGFSGTFLHWHEDFLKTLEKKFSVYCLNYRGIGLSKANKKDLSLYLLAEDIAQFIDVLSLQNVALLGFSMGGYIAQEFVLNFSEKIKSLYLVSTRAAGSKNVPCDPSVAEKMSPRQQSFEERIQDRLDLNFPQHWHQQMRPIQEKWVKQYELPECTLDLETMKQQAHAIGEWQKTFSEEKIKEYSNIKVPTHIFTGFQDLIIPYQNSVNLCEIIPKSTMTMFEDGGHGLLSQYGRQIATFIV